MSGRAPGPLWGQFCARSLGLFTYTDSEEGGGLSCAKDQRRRIFVLDIEMRLRNGKQRLLAVPPPKLRIIPYVVLSTGVRLREDHGGNSCVSNNKSLTCKELEGGGGLEGQEVDGRILEQTRWKHQVETEPVDQSQARPYLPTERDTSSHAREAPPPATDRGRLASTIVPRTSHERRASETSHDILHLTKNASRLPHDNNKCQVRPHRRTNLDETRLVINQHGRDFSEAAFLALQCLDHHRLLTDTSLVDRHCGDLSTTCLSRTRGETYGARDVARASETVSFHNNFEVYQP